MRRGFPNPKNRFGRRGGNRLLSGGSIIFVMVSPNCVMETCVQLQDDLPVFGDLGPWVSTRNVASHCSGPSQESNFLDLSTSSRILEGSNNLRSKLGCVARFGFSLSLLLLCLHFFWRKAHRREWRGSPGSSIRELPQPLQYSTLPELSLPVAGCSVCAHLSS